jgi:hypothetical protein
MVRSMDPLAALPPDPAAWMARSTRTPDGR